MILRGFVELRVINKDTLEVEQVIEQENTITLRMRDRLTTNATSSSTTNGLLGAHIIISSDSNDSVSDFWWVRSPVFGFVPAGVTSPEVIPASGPTPTYIQWTRRFDPPTVGTTFTVNTIGITERNSADAGSDKVPVNAYVKLSSPCIQTDTQLLDVVYRMQWVRDPAKTIGFTTSQITLNEQVNRINAFSGGIVPTFIYHSPVPVTYTPESGAYGTLIGGSINNLTGSTVFSGTGTTTTTAAATTNGDPYPFFKQTLVGTATTSGTIGVIYSSEYYRNAGNHFHSWKNITAPSGSSVQPIHGHASSTFSSATPNPFLDSTPATGSGRLVGGGTWTNPDFPEQYMVQMTSSGNVGSSTYQFWKRNHFGYVSTTYANRHPQLMSYCSYSLGTTPSSPIPSPSLVGAHGVNVHYNNSVYSSGGLGNRACVLSYTKIITTDDTGITVLNLAVQDYRNYDSTTTPALPVTSVRQVSVDKSTGIIWVACANTGLWKISADGNTVTHITIATHSVPSEKAYGVDIGRLNSIWAAFDGGISASFDGGVTWTNYNTTTVPAFSFVGITDNNWSSINYIKVDPSHVDDRLALIRHPGTTTLTSTTLVWWSRGTGTAITGPVDNSASINDSRLNTTGIDVSDTDGFWMLAGSASGYPKRLTYGTGTLTNVGTSTTYVPIVAFERGPDGRPCFVYVVGTSSSYTVSLIDKDLNIIIPATACSTSADKTLFENPSTRLLYMGKGIFSSVLGNTTTVSIITHGTCVGVVVDTLNTFTGPFSYLIWDKYGWNGSAWELNHSGSKTTHAAQEPLLNGVTLSFVDGTGTSFIANEYYTFGVVKGILKDNSISYTTTSSFHLSPVKTGSTFGGVVRLYPSVGTVTWKRASTQLTINPNQSLTNKSASRSYGLYAISNNRVFGDFSVVGTISPGAAVRYLSIGLSTSRGGVVNDNTVWTSTSSYANAYAFNITGNSFRPAEGGALAGTDTTITVPNTTWEIRRVGTVLTFYVGGVLKHTTSSTEHSLAIRVLYAQQNSSLNSQSLETIEPITVVSSGAGYYTEVGTVGGGDGVYDPNFLSVDVHSSALPGLSLSLDGTPVISKLANSTAMPAAGEVNIIGEYGDLIFNPADVGKTVTGSYLYVTK